MIFFFFLGSSFSMRRKSIFNFSFCLLLLFIYFLVLHWRKKSTTFFLSVDILDKQEHVLYYIVYKKNIFMYKIHKKKEIFFSN
jgi:hypothetical protein